MNFVLTSSLRPLRRALSGIALAFVAASVAHAGTPLICHPYVIGNAKSLPGSDGGWKGVNPNYDRTHLVRDTLALLTPETPVIIRMGDRRRRGKRARKNSTIIR
jgi:hypothetical protein